MANKKTFVFTGGGTGGHVTPALAIAEGIRKHHPDAFFLYVGVRGKAEDGMVQKAWKKEFEEGKAGIRFVRSRGWFGVRRIIPFAFALSLGIFKALFILLSARPHAIIATGGYVSAPIVFAAVILRTLHILKTKIFIHEQNATPGRMNKEAAKFADCIGTAFPGTKGIPQGKKEFVGYPVRSTVVVDRTIDKQQLKDQAREKLQLPQDAKIVFAFGGSQGARTINRGVVAALPHLLKDEKVYIIHGTGRQLAGNAYNGMKDVQNQLQKIKDSLPSNWEERYKPTDFFYNMGENYAASDLVICRGGAGSLYEICANGVAAIAIPKANLPGDHQAANARSLERLNALRVLYERVDISQDDTVESVDPEELSTLVLSLLNNPELRKEIYQNAQQQYEPKTTKNCAQIIDFLIGIHNKPPSNLEPKQMPEKVLGLNSNQLERLIKKVRSGKETFSEEERRIALYKIDGYAAQRDFTLPARACRMFGEGKFTERIAVLHRMALDTKQSPFTRRDAMKGLRRLEEANDESIDVILKALNDPYFETVKEALYTLKHLLFLHRSEWIERLPTIQKHVVPFTKSKIFDIRMNSFLVLSEIVTQFSELQDPLRANYFHPNWKVRKSIISCFSRLQERSIMTSAQVEEELKNILQTSNGFNMKFELKEEIRETVQKTNQKNLVKDLHSLLPKNPKRLSELTEFSKKNNIVMNITDVLDKLHKQET
ncbi:MAG: glycosyltransferase [Myxococcota bacterium]|nr:glycosyltransferase [Myxococcota bacterium]